MSAQQDDLRKRMDGAMDRLKSDYAGLRTGRASAGMLDPIQVDAYGSMMPLNQLANVTVPEPRLLVVSVWDKSMVKPIEKAIANSNLGLNPASDGQTIRVPVPELSEERRRELSKVAGQYAENAKVAIRNIRRDGMDSLKKMEKDGDISEDEQRRRSDDIQKLTDEYVKKADTLYQDKDKEIMSV
jgi:ribosome recycling factor